MRLFSIELIILASFLLAASTIGSYAQSDTAKITPQENREANLLAHRFTTRLLQTKDVKPLIKEYFVRDFIQRLDYDSGFLDKRQITPERRPELPRFYVAETNWLYLLMLYQGSKTGLKDDDDVYFPPHVKRIIEKDPDTWKAMDEVKYFDTTAEATRYFDNALRLLEKTVPLLRREAIKIRAGHNATWRKTRSQMPNDRYYKPWASVCDSACYGFSKGTRMIGVEFPFFDLTLIKINGRLRVLNFQFTAD